MTKAPCKFHLLQGACSSPVVCSAPLFLPCSLQGYRLRCLCPGRNAAWPQRAAASCLAQPRVGCGHDALQIRDLTKLRRLDRGEACLASTEQESLRRERVRRVVLHRIRETHTILADQWRHECDANISIIARDLSSAHFIGARSASPASSPIAGLARRLLHPLPKPNPVHDWTSHAADAFRYLAMTLDRTVSVRNSSRGLEYPNLGIV
jgi:hypothetical protein